MYFKRSYGIKTLDDKYLPLSTQADYGTSDQTSVTYVKDRPVYEENYKTLVLEMESSEYSITNIDGTVYKYSEATTKRPELYFIPNGKYELVLGDKVYPIDLTENKKIAGEHQKVEIILDDGTIYTYSYDQFEKNDFKAIKNENLENVERIFGFSYSGRNNGGCRDLR